MLMTAEVEQPYEDHVDNRSDCHGVPQDGRYAGGEAVNPYSTMFVEGVELSQRVLVQQFLRLGLWLENCKPRLEYRNAIDVLDRNDAFTLLRPCVLN